MSGFDVYVSPLILSLMCVYVCRWLYPSVWVYVVMVFLTFIFKHFYDYIPLIKSYISQCLFGRFPLSSLTLSPLSVPYIHCWLWVRPRWWMMSCKPTAAMRANISFFPSSHIHLHTYRRKFTNLLMVQDLLLCMSVRPSINLSVRRLVFFYAFTSWVNQKISVWYISITVRTCEWMVGRLCI